MKEFLNFKLSLKASFVSLGISSLGVPSIDPLKIDRIQISENNQGKSRRPMILDMEFKDIDLTGLSECKISNVK